MIRITESVAFSFPKNSSRDNEDSILTPRKLSKGYVFAIADGVGSYKGAKEASSTVIAEIEGASYEELMDSKGFMRRIRDRVSSLVNQSSEFSNAATTLTLGYVSEAGLSVYHVGDCRLYIKSDKKFTQLTKDHTRFQQLLDDKVFTKRELEYMGGKNFITKAITRNLDLDFDEFFVSVDDLFNGSNSLSIYIMSDGAHELWERRPRFSENTMNDLVKFGSSFIKRIERIGPVDDYSMVSFKVERELF